jgi:hypothetical protein
MFIKVGSWIRKLRLQAVFLVLQARDTAEQQHGRRRTQGRSGGRLSSAACGWFVGFARVVSGFYAITGTPVFSSPDSRPSGSCRYRPDV